MGSVRRLRNSKDTKSKLDGQRLIPSSIIIGTKVIGIVLQSAVLTPFGELKLEKN